MLKRMLALALLSASLLYGMSVSELNKASKEELMKIKGVGEKKADAIIKYRKKTKFTSVEDVTKVKGVGESLAQNIKKDIKNGTKTKAKSKTNSSKSKNTSKTTKTTKSTKSTNKESKEKTK